MRGAWCDPIRGWAILGAMHRMHRDDNASRPCIMTRDLDLDANRRWPMRRRQAQSSEPNPRWHTNAPSPSAHPHSVRRMSAEVVWQCIKKNNAFLRKGSAGRHDAIFSAEPGNLYARHSFKHSGVCPDAACQAPCNSSGDGSPAGGALRPAFPSSGLRVEAPGALPDAPPVPSTPQA
jgi:hypothetical protein